METVQQHEWKQDNKSEWRCLHCPAFMTKHKWGKISWLIRGIGFMFEEPKCITRHPEQEAGKDGSKRTELDPELPSA